MSRNARNFSHALARFSRAACAFLLPGLLAAAADQPSSFPPAKAGVTTSQSRVVIIHDPSATEAFKPRDETIRRMLDRGITNLTARADIKSAWQSLVSPKDVVGIKIISTPGADAGTRPAVVAAVVEALLRAQVRPTNIIIWDRQRADLRRAGFDELGERYGVRVEGTTDAGYDEEVFYNPERPILGQLVWGDVEFGRKGENIGRRSFVTKLLTREIKKVISITPMLNHNTVGVNGHLYSLAQGSVDNFIRFENDLLRLSTAVPEIYALPAISERVVLNITDALICQYQGEQQGLLHYSAMLNELRFSKDPVALDYLSLRELERTRLASAIAIPRETAMTNQLELLFNASLMELGASEERGIKVERMK